MAIFDPYEQRLCVRVVYDGAAGAGKTTNLQKLSQLFAAQRATEVWSPAELEGRTLYFDWMQIPAGVVAGIPLLCQVISVPGQVVLTPRRRHLLATADVIVYVADSSGASLAHARDGLDVVAELGRQRDIEIPTIFQANKQDQRDALDGARVLRALGQSEHATVVEAIATEGIGVVDTFVTAIRTLSRVYQERASRGELNVEVGRAESMEAAFASVDQALIDPEGAAEMLLQEASRSLLVAGLEAGGEATEVAEVEIPSDAAFPELPDADVPTGFIWPAHTGRTTLRSLANAGVLAAKPAPASDGSLRHAACGYVMRTGPACRFSGAEAARAALVRAARERTQLESLLASDTVVVAQAARDGAWWVWTVMPEVVPFPTALAEVSDAARRTALLEAYGVALGDTVRAAAHHGFGLDPRPTSFGVESSTLRYVGDLLPAPDGAELAATIAEGIDALGADGPIVLAAFEREIQRRLGRDDPEALGAAAARVRAMLSLAGPEEA